MLFLRQSPYRRFLIESGAVYYSIVFHKTLVRSRLVINSNSGDVIFIDISVLLSCSDIEKVVVRRWVPGDLVHYKMGCQGLC